MIVNMVTLLVAFHDGSRQDEKYQREKINMFENGAVKLVENGIDISVTAIPPVPQNIGSLTVRQCDITFRCETTVLERANCSEEQVQKNRNFWEPRVGETYFNDRIENTYCVKYDTEMQIESEYSAPNNYQYLKLEMRTCEQLDQ